jgi:hypothetical protein
MIDWNWLWVIGEIGISYGFYRWWKADDKFLAVLEVKFFEIISLSNISVSIGSTEY